MSFLFALQVLVYCKDNEPFLAQLGFAVRAYYCKDWQEEPSVLSSFLNVGYLFPVASASGWEERLSIFWNLLPHGPPHVAQDMWEQLPWNPISPETCLLFPLPLYAHEGCLGIVLAHRGVNVRSLVFLRGRRAVKRSLTEVRPSPNPCTFLQGVGVRCWILPI